MASRIAVIGLGRIGLPVCERLCAAGHEVHATDVREDCREPALAAGARWEPSAGAAAAGAEFAITILPGPGEVSALAGELTGALAPPALWIDMSTATPAVAREIAAAAAPRGVRALDAPVGGNPESAREGRLLCFAGAEASDLRAALPLLDTLAAEVVHVGPPGSGYAAKLLVNLLWFGQAAATAEALALARRAGIEPEALLGALGASAAASAFIERDAPALLRGDDLATFPLARCCEQLASVLALGDELAVPLEVAAAVARVHDGALERYGDVDGELLGARWVAERAGVRFGS